MLAKTLGQKKVNTLPLIIMIIDLVTSGPVRNRTELNWLYIKYMNYIVTWADTVYFNYMNIWRVMKPEVVRYQLQGRFKRVKHFRLRRLKVTFILIKVTERLINSISKYLIWTFHSVFTFLKSINIQNTNISWTFSKQVSIHCIHIDDQLKVNAASSDTLHSQSWV